MARIRIDVDELSASAQLLEEGDDETVTQRPVSSGRSQLDQAMNALEGACSSGGPTIDVRYPGRSTDVKVHLPKGWGK